MNININDQQFQLDACSESIKLSTLLEQYGATPPFAVAVNGDFVARADYHKLTVSGRDMIDIVLPIFGG